MVALIPEQGLITTVRLDVVDVGGWGGSALLQAEAVLVAGAVEAIAAQRVTT